MATTMLCPRGPSLCGGRSLAGGQLQAIIRPGNCLFAFPPFEITWRNLWQNPETLSACVGSRRKGNRRVLPCLFQHTISRTEYTTF